MFKLSNYIISNKHVFLLFVYATQTLSLDFSQFQRSYYLLYQSFPPNPKKLLAVITQRYNVPSGFEAQIQQSSHRICNQGILNYLLIELRRDRDLSKFWDTVKVMIEEWDLKKAVGKYGQLHELSISI